MNSKPIFQSKTAVINFLIAVATAASFFYPPAAEFVKAHAAQILTAVTLGNVALRAITHGKVTLFGGE